MNLLQVKGLTSCLAYFVICGISSLLVWLLLGRKVNTSEEAQLAQRTRIYTTHNRICLFIAGILISMTLVNLIPAVNQDMIKLFPENHVLAVYLSQVGIIACFLFIWILSISIEIVVTKCHERKQKSESQRILEPKPSSEAEPDAQFCDYSQRTSTAVVLALALVSHSFLEGLTVGLQPNSMMVATMGAISAVHECFLVVAIVLKAYDAGLHRYLHVALLAAGISLTSPIGILVGAAITGSSISVGWVVLFRCLATGGILYVVFLEMIPHCVFVSDHPRWLSCLLVTTGSVVMAVIALGHVFHLGMHSAKKTVP